ncbi:MAG: hypothetical protein RL587_408 [Actinomycetota bacterium]|jgi:predicted nucleic acid-binding Zn ribbon protein
MGWLLVVNPKDPGRSLLQRLTKRSPLIQTNNNKSTRDPLLISDALSELVENAGWQTHRDLAQLQDQFKDVVGAETAEHLLIENFDGELLTLRADSTSWATQLKYLQPVLLEKLQTAAPTLGIRNVQVLPPTPNKTPGAWRVRQGKRR